MDDLAIQLGYKYIKSLNTIIFYNIELWSMIWGYHG